MEEYECCRKNGLATEEIVGLILGIVAGIGVGILFALGLIPITINFIIIALIMSTITLAILLGVLFTANILRGCNSFYKCVCKLARFVLTGAIGTLLATTIALIIGVATITPAAIIFVALSALFFVIMIVSIVSLISCIIKQTCKMPKE